jgi:hypothetical protein
VEFRRFPEISNQFHSLFYKYEDTITGFSICDLRKPSGAGIKGMAVSQSARCAGKQCASAFAKATA